AALRGRELGKTRIAAAICCSRWFGRNRYLLGLDEILEVEPVVDAAPFLRLGHGEGEPRLLGILCGNLEGERKLSVAPGRLHIAGGDELLAIGDPKFTRILRPPSLFSCFLQLLGRCD